MIPAITHRELIKAGIPENISNHLLAEITGRSYDSIRGAVYNKQLNPTRDGLFHYLNSPGKNRFRENFKSWAKNRERKGLYSLKQNLPQPTITVIGG